MRKTAFILLGVFGLITAGSAYELSVIDKGKHKKNTAKSLENEKNKKRKKAEVLNKRNDNSLNSRSKAVSSDNTKHK